MLRASARLASRACAAGLASPPGSSSMAMSSRIFVNQGDISALSKPSQFYEHLVERIRTSKHRISLASLYLGPGDMEDVMMDGIAHARAKSPNLSVRTLIDGCRGLRPGPEGSSARFVISKLAAASSSPDSPLTELVLLDHPSVASTPRRHFGRSRLREASSTQHTKVYATDDCAVLSGANLSQDYFQDRQDRYLVLDNASAAAVLHETVAVMGQSPLAKVFSLQASASKADTITTHNYADTVLAAVEADRSEHRTAMNPEEECKRLENGLNAVCKQYGVTASTGDMVPVTLAWQCGMIGLRDDEVLFREAVASAGEGSVLDIATGYFNMPDFALDLLAAAAKRGASVRILTASPAANGFLGGRGIGAALPLGYSLLLLRGARRLADHGVLFQPAGASTETLGCQAATAPESGQIKLLEWTHPLDHDWSDPAGCAGVGRVAPSEHHSRRTFHAKGLWLEQSDEGTIVSSAGSSNFGNRSFHIDLELQAWIGPVDKQGKTGQVLEQERNDLFDTAATVCVGLRQLEQASRHPSKLSAMDIGYWVALAARVLRPWM